MVSKFQTSDFHNRIGPKSFFQIERQFTLCFCFLFCPEKTQHVKNISVTIRVSGAVRFIGGGGGGGQGGRITVLPGNTYLEYYSLCSEKKFGKRKDMPILEKLLHKVTVTVTTRRGFGINLTCSGKLCAFKMPDLEFLPKFYTLF